MGISQDIPGSRSGEGKSQHARISHVPAQQVAWGDRWDGDEYHFWISGRMREAAVHSHNLSLTRRISCQLGRPRLVIEDCVENRGYTPVAHSIVYHCNFGFPLLSEGAHLEAPSLDVVPKDEVAAAAVDDHAYMHGAQAGYVQQVFYHRMAAGADGLVSLRLVSPRLGLTMEMRYRQRELPGFVQWKQLGQGMYVLGLEPCSRRAADRPKIDTVELAPGAAIHYWLEIGVNDSERNQ
jgi:hypothetical protein